LEDLVLHQLPDQRPAITLVAPTDTGFWATLGVDAAGHHALVFGEVSEPARATVLVGSLLDIARYIDSHGPLARRLTELGAEARRGLTADERRDLRPQPTAEPAAAPPPPTEPLVALPHSGLRVPDLRLNMSDYQELPMADGVAFTATLRLDGRIVGTVENNGTGGATTYDPVALSPFRRRDVQEYAARCRTSAGHTVLDEDLLDALVTEFQTGQAIAAATRTGRSTVRLMAPWATATA